MLRPLRALLPLFAALLVPLASGCERGPRYTPPVNVVTTPWLGNAPLFMARERGLFGPTEVRIVELSTDFDAWRAIIERRAELATGTLFDVMHGIDRGADIRIVMALDFSNGADGVVAREGIPDLASLRGKRIGVEKSTLTHFVLLRALERVGLTEADVQLEHLTLEESKLALEEGRIDAASLWEPYLSQAAAPPRRKLFTSAEIPGEIIDVLVARKDVLEERPDEVARIIRGFHAATLSLDQDPEKTAEVAAGFLGTRSEELRLALVNIDLLDLGQNEKLFDATAAEGSIWKAYARSAAFMEAHRMLRQRARGGDEVIDREPLRRAASLPR
ncbi:ABC transporter substrate-binding protein [Polyangium aurulentum]|uniref:ABC transporter substrate-binding protein n=1 Tax=Polyangium aurulentum TaxID=2567896 RepID=UPI00146F8F20|nr:ABC transporter substrate-binding protein [Polyangium aurulentum]UQA62830.1 ABC transporter substrate-binding protein [Polyangium aurulentum]